MKIICVIPVYNEQDRLSELIKKIYNFQRKSKYKVKFLFVNNGSSDNSPKIIKNTKHILINLKKNMGIGYALILGLKYALKNNYTVLIHLAGNGKMLPNEIPKFLNKLVNLNYDFVNGSRFLPGGRYKTNPLFRRLAIRLLNFFLTVIYQKKITDSTCGFRAFKTKIFKGKMKFFNKKQFYTYGYEYYSYGKILSSEKIKKCEIPVAMKYPKTGSYTKIKPFVDWYVMIFAWMLSKFDCKKVF